MSRLSFVALVLTLSACASAPAEFERLVDAPGHVVFELDDGVEAIAGSSPIYLSSGGYRLVKSSKDGGLYAAPEFGVIRKTRRGFLGYPGGIWIPHDRNGVAKIFVLAGMGERLYPDLPTALALPKEAEKRMYEEASRQGIDLDKIERTGCEGPPDNRPGWATAMLICALAESERGKPDVIGELPRAAFEKLILSTLPATRSR